MELDSTHALAPMADSGHCSVIEMPVGDLEFRWETFLTHGVPVIL
jgi:hypothetical protein